MWIGEKWAFEGSTRGGQMIFFLPLIFYTNFCLTISCLLLNCSWIVVSTYVDCFPLFLYVLLPSLKVHIFSLVFSSIL